MKIRFSHTIALAAALSVFGTDVPRSFAGDTDADPGALTAAMPPVVKAEFARTQQELQLDLALAKRRLQALEAEKTQAIAQSQAAAMADLAGIKTLQDYELLLVTRYTDNRAEFQSGAQLSEREVDNLNKLFTGYLQATPFKGRVSAGQARKTLKWGVTRLTELNQMHAEPTEKNNSDLEIIAKQQTESEALVHRIVAAAETLNFRLGTDFGRVPATSSAPTSAAAIPGSASYGTGTASSARVTTPAQAAAASRAPLTGMKPAPTRAPASAAPSKKR